MSTDRARAGPLEIWGGIEATVNRVGDRWFDQMAWAGHDQRPGDLARFASLGLRVLRYPVLWERVAPVRLDACDWRQSDDRLSSLRQLGIRPIVGLLHHGSGPAYTSLLDPQFPEKLAQYAGAVARRYPWLIDFTPINEPLTTARFSGLYGHWYPHDRSDRTFIRALLNQLRGIVLAMRAIRAVIPAARLIQTEDCGRTFGRRALRDQIVHEEHRRWLTWDLLTGCVDHQHALHAFLRNAGMSRDDEAFFREANCPPDILGLNYYVTSDRYLDPRVDRYPADTHGSNGRQRYADVDAVRARRDGIAGHEAHLISAWRRYRRPVAITEVHLGCTREEQMRWLVEGWTGAHAARARGADVRAVTAWALLGSYNWDSLVTRDAGHYEPGAFDVRGTAPRATALATVIRTLSAGETPRHPALDGVGWWRRPVPALDGPPQRSSTSSTGASLLVVGSTGALGRAFQRICGLRRLTCELVDRHEMNFADRDGVDALLGQRRPWAVIDATDDVEVDDAERDAETCHRVCVSEPIALAAACRRHRLPFVTFSSDPVFDGQETSPSVQRKAPAHIVVSQAYLSDLVHAALDLIIDGESGIWHLANGGAMRWFEPCCDDDVCVSVRPRARGQATAGTLG
jgi:dTDP-4-dehydrorhamnose reductase